MFNNKDVIKAKENMEGILGSKVKIFANKGRKKTSISEGFVYATYPSVFTIQMTNQTMPTRKISFSYTDLLTHNVEITLCD